MDVRLLVALVVGCASAACADGSLTFPPNPPVARTGGIDSGPPPEGRLPEPPPDGEWIEVAPGGDTTCSLGAPFRFFVRGGRSDRVLIDFEGGGACWNQTTCALASRLFSAEIRPMREYAADIESGKIGGIFDPQPGRTFASWTLVHIPYCTGDIHWGNTDHEYAEDLTIKHRGFVNASAALDWVYAHYLAPANVFVTGCSGGAYGAALHSAYIAQHYTRSRIAVLADAGAGITTESFLNDSLPNWNAQGSLPSFVPGLDRPLAELSVPDLYSTIGKAFPQHRFAQTATQYDDNQIFYYTAMGGQAQDWPAQFRASLSQIESSTPNFRSYIQPGSMHCALPYPFFFSREVAGERLADWTESLALGEETPASVACEGAECCDDPVCDACEGRSEGNCKYCKNWPASWSECAPHD